MATGLAMATTMAWDLEGEATWTIEDQNNFGFHAKVC